MDDIEIEIQVNIENSQPLIEFLEQKGEFKSEEQQRDKYFFPAHRDFTAVRPIKEWLRLRDTAGRYSVAYKNWHYDENGRSSHCDEYETQIDNLEQFNKIFTTLDFKPLITVDKLRKIWQYKDYEIALDSVKDLGDFVEIEYISEKEGVDPKKVTDEMVVFLKNLGCGQIKRNYKGYPFLLLFPEESEYEVV